MPLYMRFELLSTCSRTINAWRCYILVIPYALMVCLHPQTCDPRTLGVYIRQTTHAHCMTINCDIPLSNMQCPNEVQFLMTLVITV